MSFGEVDTLNLLFDKLQSLLNDSQGYYESFLDANTLYKQGKLSEKEFFEKLGDYVVAYSALEFLAVKVIFELKKSLNRMAGGTTRTTAMGSTSVGMTGFGMTSPSQTMSPTAQMPGRPPQIISAAAFSATGALPTPDPSLLPQKSTGPSCTSCGASIRPHAKFCTKCGNKLQ
ncbi:MAG TPA: zinc-ribbon domain-containing protein [Nitrosopumilaceae archaeon]|nr:zinc-ribbon domain-containing protein [Nitrosopumilaceae archaeon]